MGLITTAIVKEINVSEENSELKNNYYKVEIPFFNSSIDDEKDSYITNATACTLPGLYNTYQVGDLVYVGFVDRLYDQAVILGSIYKGSDYADNKGALKLESLNVTGNVSLPENTVLGKLKANEIYNNIQNIDNLKTAVEELQQGSGGAVVRDVLVDEESVVEQGVAYVDLTGKQDKLTSDNAGPGIIISTSGGGESHDLPAEYQEVQYLEANGTQYIDTGFAFDTAAKCSNFEIELKVAYSSDPDIFLGAFNSNSQCFKFDISGSTKTTMFIPAGDGQETAHSITGLIIDGKTLNNIKINRTSNTFTKYLNGSLQGTETVTTTKSLNKSLYLFACNGEAGTYEEGRMAYCKITANGISAREFIPCYRKSDIKPGMYDKANNVFYTNDASGNDFTPGPEVGVTDLTISYTNTAGYQTATQVASSISSHNSSTSSHSDIRTLISGKQDALPEVSNNKYLHTNSSTGALEWSEINNYSESEQMIGTWIDGQPIYRKVFIWTSGLGMNVDTNIGTIGSTVDKVIDMRHFQIYNNSWYENYYNAAGHSNTFVHLRVDKSSGDVYACAINDSWSGDVTVIIEYTK